MKLINVHILHFIFYKAETFETVDSDSDPKVPAQQYVEDCTFAI